MARTGLCGQLCWYSFWRLVEWHSTFTKNKNSFISCCSPQKLCSSFLLSTLEFFCFYFAFSQTKATRDGCINSCAIVGTTCSKIMRPGSGPQIKGQNVNTEGNLLNLLYLVLIALDQKIYCSKRSALHRYLLTAICSLFIIWRSFRVLNLYPRKLLLMLRWAKVSTIQFAVFTL